MAQQDIKRMKEMQAVSFKKLILYRCCSEYYEEARHYNSTELCVEHWA